jgi:hypothetical protein
MSKNSDNHVRSIKKYDNFYSFIFETSSWALLNRIEEEIINFIILSIILESFITVHNHTENII